ncbi:MAG TPA: hypothetical protein VGC38_04245 [Pseudolabrys sp.]
MKFGWIALALVVAGLALTAANPALARVKHKAACNDRPQTFSWDGIISNPAPQPNGCSPAVYNYGRFVGQDPDPFIRQQLMRDPQTGYSQF